MKKLLCTISALLIASTSFAIVVPVGGTTEQINEVYREPQEVLVNYDTWGLVVMDGVTLGGHPLPTINDVKASEQKIQTHADNDVARWKEFYALQKQVLDLQAGIQNKVLDTNNTIDIEEDAQGTGYTVDNALGGRTCFSDVIVLLDLIPGNVYVNDQNVWSTGGLGLGEVSSCEDVSNGDIITASGIASINFTPYVAGL